MAALSSAPARAVALGALSVALFWWAACGSDDAAPAGGGGSGAATTSSGSGGYTGPTTTNSVTSASSSSGGGEGGCAPEPLPPGVPESWVEYTDWSCDCRFYVPGSAAALPAPIAWESCPDAGDGIDCRMMVVDWTEQQTAVAVDPTMELGEGGDVVLAFSRSSEHGNLYMVADADGGSHSGIFWPHDNDPNVGCWLSDQGMNEGKHVFSVQGLALDGPSTKHQGAIGGAIDELHPPLLATYINEDDPLKDGWRCGASWLVQHTYHFALLAHRWDMSETFDIHSPAVDPEGKKASQLQVMGEAVFFTTASTTSAGINVWDLEHGFRPFIRWLGDTTRGAGNLGTDGVDMVWSYGEGKGPGETSYPIRSVMTSPFTTDPAQVQTRRLRSQPTTSITLSPWPVGCGFGAHEGAANTLLVVRLSDGWSWEVPNAPGRSFGKAIGITCEEVFVLGGFGDHSINIARVRLDSLGAGVPPD